MRTRTWTNFCDIAPATDCHLLIPYDSQLVNQLYCRLLYSYYLHVGYNSSQVLFMTRTDILCEPSILISVGPDYLLTFTVIARHILALPFPMPIIDRPQGT